MNAVLQTENKIMQKRDRIVFIEFLRIVACFCVIVNHTNSKVFLQTSPSLLWFISLLYFFVSKIAVPIFIIIIGYVMLDRQDSYQKILVRCLRMAGCLGLFSVFYYIYYYLIGTRETLDIKEFVRFLLTGQITNAYWYLYLYIGIILMMPFIQKMVSVMEKKDFHAFFFISGIVFSVWPMLVHYIHGLTYSKDFRLPVFDSYICMLLFGCYVKRYCKPSKKWRNISIIILLTMCGVNIGLTLIEFSRTRGRDYLFFENRVFLPIVLASCCCFYIATTIEFSEKIKKWILSLGGLTFGIYLVSDFFIKELEELYETLIQFGMYPMLAMLIYEIVVFVVGAVTTYLLKKIPFIKKIV